MNEDPKDAILREYQEEIARLKERLSQIPASSAPPSTSSVLDEQEKEAIMEEARLKSNKENEALRAETTAELEKLKSANEKTAADREQLEQKLEAEKKARKNTENERLELQKQLIEMEAKLMTGGEFANNAKKQEAELRRAHQELALKREQELTLNRRMDAQEEEKLHLEEKYSSLADEVQAKTKKLKKLWAKYQQAKTEVQDLEREFLIEKRDAADTIRDVTRTLKLKEFIISSFIPPRVRLLLLRHVCQMMPANMHIFSLLQVCSLVRCR